MERIYQKNKHILEIESELNQSKTLDLILEDLSIKSTPIVESLDETYDQVTFLYEDLECSENVLLMVPIVWSDMKAHLMDKIEGTNIWYSTYKVKNNGRFLYRISVNDSLKMNCEIRMDKCIHDVHNPNITTFIGQEAQEVKFSNISLSKSLPDKWAVDLNTKNKGKVIKHDIQSEILDEKREFSIYLPYSYDKSVKDYNYVLVFDGYNHLDRLLSADALDNLIEAEKIPNTIGIFLKSNSNRAKNFKICDEFAGFLIKELLPMIRGLYNISDNPKDAVISGVSLGGLASVYLGFSNSNVFGNILSQSGSFWYGADNDNKSVDKCWMSDYIESIKEENIKLYMNVGLFEGPPMLGPNKNLHETLEELNYDVDFEYFTGGHDHLSWGEYFAKGLISLSNRNNIDESKELYEE